MKTGQLKITLVRSPISRLPKHRRTIKALGLRKLHQTVIRPENPAIIGMIEQVNYLIEVEKA